MVVQLENKLSLNTEIIVENGRRYMEICGIKTPIAEAEYDPITKSIVRFVGEDTDLNEWLYEENLYD